MSQHTQDCSCYRCYFDRTHPEPFAAFLAVLAVTVKTCPLCGGMSQDECAENDCANDWTDFWLPEDPTPWCTACGAMTQAKCTCGPTADND